MSRSLSVILLIAAISIAFIFYLSNQKPEINFDRFNLVSPGILRTPDDRFENLEDFPFKANYLTIGDTRIHYLDEGPKNGEVIYLLHGEKDNVVPQRLSRKILNVFPNSEKKFVKIKNGDHSLSRVRDLKILSNYINKIIDHSNKPSL